MTELIIELIQTPRGLYHDHYGLLYGSQSICNNRIINRQVQADPISRFVSYVRTDERLNARQRKGRA